MPKIRSINTGIIFSTLLLLSVVTWAQTPNQPLVPANRGGVASLASTVLLDPTQFDVVGDVVSIKFYSIGGTEYAVYATSTGIVFIPSGSFDSKLGHIFVPRNTMQGDLADFVVRTDLTPAELHILSTQVKGEMILRYNISAVFEGASDRTSFLGEPRFVKTDLVGDISLFFSSKDGFTYTSDIDGNIVRFESRDPSAATEEESYQHNCKGSSAVQYDETSNVFYFACPDAKVSIITVNSASFNGSEERSEPLLFPLTTVDMLLDETRGQLIVVSQAVDETATVTFANITGGQWAPSDKTVTINTGGATISSAALDAKGLLYVAQTPSGNASLVSALHQIDVPNRNYEVQIILDPAEAGDVNLMAFSSSTGSIYFGTLDTNARLVLSKWTGAVACEANCNGNGVCTPARTCTCTDPVQFVQPWCTPALIGPVSSAPSPVASNPPQAEQAPEAGAAPVVENAPEQAEQPPVEATSPSSTHVPVANVTSPVANATSPSTETPTGPNMGLVVLGILMGLIAVAGVIAFVVNIYVQKKEKRRGARLRDLEASNSGPSKNLAAERARLLDDM
eukprot:TRINITY_DN6162_c0_g1_i1.p1 TRINITY_DN6162_c0_g1~~TRINITY_DN6162_c0_g1_i1.p1  ORF type:complete len:567 (+),score=122.27 TRINITY_DN6162_c0_g1_i1:138-1838(+)